MRRTFTRIQSKVFVYHIGPFRQKRGRCTLFGRSLNRYLIFWWFAPRILTCIQKVCKKTEIHANIWPYIKNSNLYSKGMQKKTEIHAKYDLISRILTCIQKVCKRKQKFTQKYDLILKIITCIQKVCKKTEIHAKIWPYIKNSNLHSKGMQKNRNSRKNMT